jgi:hypothetical protein
MGKRAMNARRALQSVQDSELHQMKREFLRASRADGAGGATAQGVKWWVMYRVHGVHRTPIPRRHVTAAELDEEEDTLEDFVVWFATTRPSGIQCSADTIKKYVSSIRAFLFRTLHRVFGHGAAGSIIPDLLQGYARLVDQPPALERDGCTPSDLSVGMQQLGVSMMWRAALSFGEAALARGCEFALDSGRREVFEASQHMVPADVTFFERDGVRHARIRMRKRKDLRVLRGKQVEVVLAGGSGAYLEPVVALEAWLAQRRAMGVSEDRPLFCHDDGSAITVAQVRTTVKAVMAAAGRDPARFGAHSLRIGGATAALAAGVSPQAIRLMGRWSSDIYEIYCRMSIESALGVGQAIASAFVTSMESEAGFRTESLEYMPDEIREMRRAMTELGAEEEDM